MRFESEVLDEETTRRLLKQEYAPRDSVHRIIESTSTLNSVTGQRRLLPEKVLLPGRKAREPYYPVNDEKNQALYQKYAKLAEKEEHVIFGGRLGEYKYYDMDKVIASAMACAKEELNML